MPVTSTGDSERDRERSKDGDRDEKGERGLSKSQQKLSSSKTKDLSHVPCKFFKVGSCTAGSSCPFSHTVLEPGAQKDVCAWFVKGNCKFGHKCALAHVLPGQSMSMDRKNKKAAQVATGGGKSDSKSSGRPGKRDAQVGRPPALMSLKASISPSAPAPAIKNTDFASFGVLDETSKLPSAPAHGKQPVQGSTDAEPSSNKSSTSSSEAVEIKEPSSTPAQPVSPSLPVSSPRRSDREHSPASRAPIDFGPIGSPPRSSNATSHPHPVSRLNGSTNHGASFSPGTSPSARNNNGTPTNTFLSTSPFSAPGSQTVFNFSERSGMGIATSLGSGYAMSGGTGTAHGKPTWGSQVENEDNLVTRRAQALEMASSGNREEGGDDFEDFLPSSLTDLLTPEERSRRMLRTNSGQGAAAQGDSTHPIVSPSGRTLGVPLATPSGPGNGHRYSRSVPAPSLLGDIGSIWSTNQGAANGGLTPNAGTPLSGGLPSSPGRLGGLGNGTPGSFTQGNSGFGGRATFDPLGEEFAGSPSNFLAPSNASAAFLPGIHAQYLKSKQGQTLDNGIGGVIRNTGSPLYPSTGKGTLQSSLAAATSRLTGGPGYGTPTGTGSFADLGQNGEFLQRPTLFSSNTANNNSMRPIPSSHLSSNNDDPQFALSPATRALQSHAPGQSLPQGLAAGYSRIHALPPPLPLSSPGSGGIGAGGFSVSPGLSATFNAGPYGSNNGPNNRPNEWGGSVGGGFSRLYSGISQSNSGLNLGGPPGLALPSHYMGINVNNTGDSAHTGAVGAGEPDPMSSKLSYSAAAAKGAPAGGVVSPHKSQWDGQQQGATGASSPLNKPVTGDDDDLFILDA
ncbi:hypothetical protein E1B28_006103 [Marasmius oreades]|uniref:C3H1-type domain-containing protein n=1 Tax=Marasmius oreades TaxID=181124 RepID=A0A9P7UUX8_9AGAR|nr:uncharacterized protein E1B28_006103 [Marasmius oreades]KAG7095342.1 hypothetical protein E1B28_006103 [Marasmius oreades]